METSTIGSQKNSSSDNGKYQISIPKPGNLLKSVKAKYFVYILVPALLASLYLNYTYRTDLLVFKNRLYETEGQLSDKNKQLKDKDLEAEYNMVAFEGMTFYAAYLEEVVNSSQGVLETLSKFSSKQIEANDASDKAVINLIDALRCNSTDFDCIRTYILRASDQLEVRKQAQSEADIYFDDFVITAQQLREANDKLDDVSATLFDTQ